MNNERDQLLLIFKERYDFELDRKKSFDESISIPVTLLSFLVAGIFYTLVDEDLSSTAGAVNAAKICIVGPLAVACVVAFAKLGPVFMPRPGYQTFPAAKEINKFYTSMTKYKEAAGPGEPTPILSLMNDSFIQLYSKCSDHNYDINQKRGEALEWVKSSKLTMADKKETKTTEKPVDPKPADNSQPAVVRPSPLEPREFKGDDQKVTKKVR